MRYEDVEVLQNINAREKDAKYRKICCHRIVLHTSEGRRMRMQAVIISRIFPTREKKICLVQTDRSF